VNRALRKKKKLWKRTRCGPEEMSTVKEAERLAMDAMRKAKWSFKKKLLKEKAKKSKPFYAYMKGRTKKQNNDRPAIRKNKVLAMSDSEMAGV
jgi:hypothetical protein